MARAGYAKLADFGLAKVVDTSAASAASTATVTVPGVVLGTVAYMSPEQAAGAPVDHRSDIFSFGVMTYEMLCGVRPFSGETDIDVLHAIQRVSPPPLAEYTPRMFSGSARTPRAVAPHSQKCQPPFNFASASANRFRPPSIDPPDHRHDR